MTTLASPEIVAYMRAWEDLFPSAVISGIVGDPAHQASGGYHISIEDQSSSNFSVVRPDDKAPPGNWSRKHAVAGDMSMSTADMIVMWNRVYAVWANRANDPRAKYFNAFNGWNGVGSAERLDFVAGTRTNASSDHTWHDHDETRRRYYNDPVAFNAKLSVFRGEGIAQYIYGGNDMNLDDILVLPDGQGKTGLQGRTPRHVLANTQARLGYLWEAPGSPQQTVAGVGDAQPAPGSLILKLVGMPSKLDDLTVAMAALTAALAAVAAQADIGPEELAEIQAAAETGAAAGAASVSAEAVVDRMATDPDFAATVVAAVKKAQREGTE